MEFPRQNVQADGVAPTIGIAVPTFNSGRTLDWTLLSLSRLTRVNAQILVADSGSTDNTLQICERWQVRHMFVPRGNMYIAINAALRQLDASWLTYLNSDDIVYPGGYARLIETAQTSNADIAYGRCDFVDGEGRHLYAVVPASPASWPALLRLGVMPLSQPAAVFRREVFETLRGFNESARTVSDFDFFMRAHEAGRRIVRVTGPSIAAFRKHEGQLSSIRRKEADTERGRFLAAAGLMARRLDPIRHWLWRLENAGELIQGALRSKRFQRRRL